MKIAMRTLMAGPDGVVQPGETCDRPDAEAQELIRGGFAEPAQEPKPTAPKAQPAPQPAPAK